MTQTTHKPEDLPHFRAVDAPDWGVDFDTTAAEVFEDEAAGLMRTSDDEIFVFRNADLKALMAHPDLGNQSPDALATSFAEEGVPGEPGFQTLMRNSLFTMQPPVHGPARQLVARQLTAKMVGRYAEAVRQITDDLLDRASESSEIDFRSDVAAGAMAGFWSTALGVSFAEAEEACRITARVQRSVLLDLPPEEIADINVASREMLSHVGGLLERQLARGEDDLLSALARDYAQMEGVGRPDVLHELFGVGLLDGLNALGIEVTNVVHALLSSDWHHQAVRDDPSLIANAFYEGTRLHPAITLTAREALREFEYEGLVVPEGTPVNMCWLLGNRDPAVFADPGGYAFGRQYRRHTTFGGGFYICPGRNVVKVVCEAVLGAVTDPSVHIEPAGEVRWRPRSKEHEPLSMPVAVRRR